MIRQLLVEVHTLLLRGMLRFETESAACVTIVHRFFVDDKQYFVGESMSIWCDFQLPCDRSRFNGIHGKTELFVQWHSMILRGWRRLVFFVAAGPTVIGVSNYCVAWGLRLSVVYDIFP